MKAETDSQIDPRYKPPSIRGWHWFTNSNAFTAEDALFNSVKYRSLAYRWQVQPFNPGGDVRWAIYYQIPGEL